MAIFKKPKLTVLSVLIVVACFATIVRVGNLANNIVAYVHDAPHNMQETMSTAHAADDDANIHHEEGAEDQAAAPMPDVKVEDTKNDVSRWTDALDTDLELPELRVEMFKELITRREELDKRQRILQQREALLRAAEQELERKYEELTQLKSEIGALLEEQSAAELARIKSLVKTYEGMKAKDAARIFNTLSMDVLIEVMSQMSERKTAPIIAAMETERARQVTVLLAEQKKLPSLPVQ